MANLQQENDLLKLDVERLARHNEKLTIQNDDLRALLDAFNKVPEHNFGESIMEDE